MTSIEFEVASMNNRCFIYLFLIVLCDSIMFPLILIDTYIGWHILGQIGDLGKLRWTDKKFWGAFLIFFMSLINYFFEETRLLRHGLQINKLTGFIVIPINMILDQNEMSGFSAPA